MTTPNKPEAVRPQTLDDDVRSSRVPEQLPLIGTKSTTQSKFSPVTPDKLLTQPDLVDDTERGHSIRHTVVDTWLGPMLVAATGRGIFRVQFGDDEARLRDAFVAEFSNTTILEPDAEFHSLVRQTIEVVETGHTRDIPLDVAGTAFQIRVWNALRRIPAGVTVTYGELAQEIGQPTASRAVATACGSNEIAVLIPCHRVVGKDGSLTGYRWGMERKKALLERELSLQ